MGRTNPNLKPFLQQGLEKNLFINLKYEIYPDEFSLELPRFERSRCMDEFEKILKAWYIYTGKGENYISYSNAKSVLQAALKKSVYLVSLDKKKLRFRFATSEEVKEKRALLKSKSISSHKTSPPSSPSTSDISSSGYESGQDIDPKNDEMDEVDLENIDVKEDDTIDWDAFLNELGKDDFSQPQPDLNMPVVNLKFYWRCSRKVDFGSVVLLMCDKQFFVENEGSNSPGDVVISNEILEAKTYTLKATTEIGGKLFLFFESLNETI